MSKIEDFYQLRDQYREMFSDDADEELWKVKEETFLRDELATAIRESVAQVFSSSYIYTASSLSLASTKRWITFTCCHRFFFLTSYDFSC